MRDITWPPIVDYNRRPDGYIIDPLTRGTKRRKDPRKTSRKKAVIARNFELTGSTCVNQYETEEYSSSDESGIRDTRGQLDKMLELREFCSQKRSEVSSTY